MTITKLELLCNGFQIGVGTGFFYKHEGAWFLVTNWHVLAGCDPNTGQPRHKSGGMPDQCRFFYSVLTENGAAWKAATYNLGDAFDGSTFWLQHPDEGQAIDVAALPIKPVHRGTAKDLLDAGGNDPDMFMDLGGELFLPGYPLGLAAAGYMALWKRASIASSLEFGESINRFFYVDTATREGMSGAPCLAISNWRHYSLDRASGKMRAVENPIAWRFLGVYSGRLNPSDSFEAQIGIVWRETLVHEIVSRGVRGTVKLLGA